MKKHRFQLNDRQLTLLEMIHILSNGKDFLIVDQLLRGLILFSVYRTESAARMAMKELEEKGLIEKVDKGTSGYKHVFLTYRGAIHIDFDQKKRARYKETTEDTIVRRVEYLYQMAEEYKVDTFYKFVNGLKRNWSTLLMPASATACLEYQDRIEKMHKESGTITRVKDSFLYRHRLRLEWERGYLLMNLRDTPAKMPDDTYLPNLVDLIKKNIFIKIMRKTKDGNARELHYVKILNDKVPYTFQKFINDLVYIAHINNDLFPDNTRIRFEIVAQSNREKVIIENNLKEKSFDTNKQRDIYAEYIESVFVSALDVNKYIVSKDRYDA